MNVLVAQSQGNTASLTNSVRALGHSASCVTDGAAAFKAICDRHFDVVICDQNLEGASCWDLCEHARGLKGRSYTFFFLLANRGRTQDYLEFLMAGIDDYLYKPIAKNELVARLTVAERALATKCELADAQMYFDAANHRFSELYAGLPIACLTCDTMGEVQEWNRACKDLFGVEAVQELASRSWRALWNEVDRQRIREAIKRVLTGEKLENEEWTYRASTGEEHYLICHMFPIRYVDKSIVGVICTYVDITMRKKAERRIAEQMDEIRNYNVILNSQKCDLERVNAQLGVVNTRLQVLASTDGLTDLNNHRSMQDQLWRQFRYVRRFGGPLSLLLLDIDRFKDYNDTFGHPAGDDVLVMAARVLQDRARATDFVARYGGEEFAVILAEAEHSGAASAAERFRKAIEETTWPRRPVTVSVGIATLTREMTSPSDLISEADRALYESKLRGRNCVTHASQLPPGGFATLHAA